MCVLGALLLRVAAAAIYLQGRIVFVSFSGVCVVMRVRFARIVLTAMDVSYINGSPVTRHKARAMTATAR